MIDNAPAPTDLGLIRMHEPQNDSPYAERLVQLPRRSLDLAPPRSIRLELRQPSGVPTPDAHQRIHDLCLVHSVSVEILDPLANWIYPWIRMTRERRSTGMNLELKRLARIAGAVLLSVVLAAGLATTADAHVKPGKLVKIEQLPDALKLPGSAKAQRLHYTSTGFDGRPTVVSGALFVPSGKAPKTGWPVLSWAHGTIGIADNCANSVSGRSQRDIDYLTSWLEAGYAIVASDYEGFGTPGTHPYLNGRSEAYGLIDVVRAGRQADKSLGRKWIASGQSQGGQAVLFAGAMQRKYAPELDYRGTISTAPGSQWRMTFDAVKPFTPDAIANPFVVLILAGTKASHPYSFDPDRYLTAFGKELYQKAISTECYTAIAQLAAGKKSQDLYDVDAAEADRLLALMIADGEIPIKLHEQPIFVAQGTADTVVYPAATTLHRGPTTGRRQRPDLQGLPGHRPQRCDGRGQGRDPRLGRATLPPLARSDDAVVGPGTGAEGARCGEVDSLVVAEHFPPVDRHRTLADQPTELGVAQLRTSRLQ